MNDIIKTGMELLQGIPEALALATHRQDIVVNKANDNLDVLAHAHGQKIIPILDFIKEDGVAFETAKEQPVAVDTSATDDQQDENRTTDLSAVRGEERELFDLEADARDQLEDAFREAA